MTNFRLIDQNNTNRLFRRLALLTVVVVYLLILIGGIVRSTGSGMGCPDWPKCFGSWVPPTEVSQLPPNYQEIYGAKLKGEVEFNATKTWIEYLNRLFGVFTGVLIFGTLLASIPFLKKDRPVFFMSLAAFLLTGFQGWLGSKVVSAELSPFIVTLHMLLAIVIVFVLLYVMARSFSGYIDVEKVENKQLVDKWLKWTISLSLLQVLIGTQVREAMDVVMVNLGNGQRDNWIENLGVVFYIHRSFSIVFSHFAFISSCFSVGGKNAWVKGIIYKLSFALLLIVFVEILTGIVLAYLSVPPAAQPIHLTLATVSVGVQFVVWLLLNAESVFKQKMTLKVEKINI